jgi:hypothetical protein
VQAKPAKSKATWLQFAEQWRCRGVIAREH